MKTYSIITILIAAIALGSCSSAYRSAQTPDAVYYSPKEDNGGAQSSDSRKTVAAQGDNAGGGNYIVYDDGSSDSYYGNDYDGYYSQRINMFDRPGSLYAFNNYYMGYPYMGMGLGYSSLWNYSFGWPSFSLGFNWGLPYGRWYNPYYAAMYSPYPYGMFSPWYGYGGYPYYGGYGYGGYYGGGYGKYINITPRPASSYGPRRSVDSRAGTGIRGVSGNEPASTSPRRVFNAENNSGTIDRSGNSPRRVFKAKPDERPVNVNSNNRTVETERPRGRIFRRSTDNTPARSERPTEIQRQSPTETRTFQQPTRTFEQPSRSYQSESSSPVRSSAPTRSFSPRGR